MSENNNNSTNLYASLSFKRPFDLIDKFNRCLSMGPRKKPKTDAQDASEPPKDQPATPPPPSSDDANKADAPKSKPKEPVENKSETTSNNNPAKAADVNRAHQADVNRAQPADVNRAQPADVNRAQPADVNRAQPADVNRVQQQAENRRSWYGSWSQKSGPIAEVSNDVLSTSAPVNSRLDHHRRPSTPGTPNSPKRLLSGASSVKDLPLAASTTRLEVTSRHNSDSELPQTKEENEEKNEEKNEDASNPVKVVEPDAQLLPDPKKQENTKSEQQKPASSSGWFSWWSRPDGYDEKAEETKRQAQAALEEARLTPLPSTTPGEGIPERTKLAPPAENPTTPTPEVLTPTDPVPAKTADATQGRSWFRLWSSTQNADSGRLTAVPELKGPPKSNDAKSTEINRTKSKGVEIPVIAADSPLQEPSKDEPKEPPPQRKSTSWAFWSKEKPGPDTNDEGPIHKQVGEIAVADTPSQSQPEAAQFNEQEQPPPKEQPKPKANQSRGRQAAKDKDSLSKLTTPAVPTPVKTIQSQSPSRKAAEVAAPTAPATPAAPTAPKQQAKQTKQTKQTDLILPEFRHTYSLIDEPSLWEKIRRLFVGAEPPAPHLHITKEPPRIKKAIAIGVHGFFPSPLFQKVLGAPTGTSIRFANHAATAIKGWTEARGYECDIEKVALEGEGFVQDRVDTLWELLLNWIEHVRRADFILVACHSQGVPVAVMLIARLVQFGCVNAARVGICAMAGVNLGPFAEYRTRMFGPSALELFDFSNPASKVSQLYLKALEEVLSFGVRVVYVGSMDDQLVSLESAIFSNISHPYIYRAVFVDGRLHSPDFITHLVSFALKLRNLGLPDHGLIRELSPALAGNLYTGDGHSSLYNSTLPYQLALTHALETTSLAPPPNLTAKLYEGPPGAKEWANPFFLPWAMRGILEEEKVKTHLGDEAEKLRSLFKEWKPVNKGLKDVRFRLEALGQSKL